jgi:hypothetical protein
MALTAARVLAQAPDRRLRLPPRQKPHTRCPETLFVFVRPFLFCFYWGKVSSGKIPVFTLPNPITLAASRADGGGEAEQ